MSWSRLRYQVSIGFLTALGISWLLDLPEYVLDVAATRLVRVRYLQRGQMASFHLAFGVVCVDLVSYFVLGEHLTPIQLLGFVLLTVATVLITYRP